ncbi:MAG TPA: hypothetical protein VGD27_15495 [Longimicrobiales bacterium]
MRIRMSMLLALFLVMAPAAYAQEAVAEPEQPRPTLQERLMPEATTVLIAPVKAEAPRTVEGEAAVANAVQRRGSGTGLIIAGGALLVAGLLIGDDAGTVLAVAGAAIGAYGLYLYFG